MVFAPSIGIAILLMILLRIFALYAVFYLLRLVLRSYREPDYFRSIKRKPFLHLTKVGIACLIIGLAVADMILTSKATTKTREEAVLMDKRLNPVLSEDTEIGGFLLPAGTKIENHNIKYNKFQNASFSVPYQFKGFKITWIENPNNSSAAIKLYETSVIDGFNCEKNKRLYLYFENDKVWVQDCILAEDQSHNEVKWVQGSVINTSKKEIIIKGIAEFKLSDIEYKQYLNYAYNRINKTKTYKDEFGKLIFTSKPGHKSKLDKNGQYSIQFTSLIKGVNFKITNRATGEMVLDKADEKGRSKIIITEEPAVYDFEYVFVNAK